MSSQSAQRGFTLIEVLVALTLMALVSLISWRGLDAVQQTGERLDERSEETLALVRALGQIERDLLLHAGADVLLEPASTAPGGSPGETQRSAARMPPGVVWNPETGLHLVRSAGNGLWQRIHWYLHEGKLMRAAGAPSYLLPLLAPETAVTVLEQVQALSVRLWLPGQGWTEPGNVQDSAPGTQRANTPAGTGQGGASGLEVALYRQGQAANQPYRKVVVLP